MRRYVIAIKVGRKIRICRKKIGMTQEELAYKIGMHASTVGRIERGEINPPLQTVNRIAQALKINPKNLFF